MKRKIKALSHVVIYKEDDEFQVVVPGQPDATYYCGDWSDALETAIKIDAQCEQSSIAA